MAKHFKCQAAKHFIFGVGPSCHHRPMDELTDEQTAMLALEAQRWKYAGTKAAAIREVFDISSVVYYARLNWLIDQPAAEAAQPMLVRRLRRLRDARRAVRKG